MQNWKNKTKNKEIVTPVLLDERTKKAFDFASDSTKQLITLATAIVTLTITFQKDLIPDPIKKLVVHDVWMVIAAWICYGISILFGLATLLALTGWIGSERVYNQKVIFKGNVVLPSLVQIAAFVVGTVFSIMFAIKVLLYH